MKRNTGHTDKRVILKARSLGLLYAEGSVTTRSVLAVSQYSVTMEKWPEDLLQKWKQFSERPTFVFGVNVEFLTSNDSYRGRTAPLTSKVAFYIFIQQI